MYIGGTLHKRANDKSVIIVIFSPVHFVANNDVVAAI